MTFARSTKLLISSAAILSLSAQAFAIPSSVQALLKVVKPITIQKMDDLEFGTTAPDLNSGGIVTVNPENDDDSTCGAPLNCFDAGDRARFKVSGLLLALVNIDVSDSINIENSAGDIMLVDNFKLDTTYAGGWIGQLTGICGQIDFGVGADLHVGANQATGDYTGTFVVTANYQ